MIIGANNSLKRRRFAAQLNSGVRPHNNMNQSAGIASPPTGPWVWLFPLAYGLHVAEEYAFRFPAYIANVPGAGSQLLLPSVGGAGPLTLCVRP